jgi:hypothetical protein
MTNRLYTILAKVIEGEIKCNVLTPLAITNYPDDDEILALKEIAIKNNLEYIEVNTKYIEPWDFNTLLLGMPVINDLCCEVNFAKSNLVEGNTKLINFRIGKNRIDMSMRNTLMKFMVEQPKHHVCITMEENPELDYLDPIDELFDSCIANKMVIFDYKKYIDA